MEPETRLSVAVIARDEQAYIAAALLSAAPVADELVVLLDARSADDTAAIARRAGAAVVVEAWVSFPRQRNRALQLCRGDWVLFLDADERLSPELLAELRAFKRSAPDGDGFWIPRQNLYFGRRLRGGGWYPDRQLRLLRRAAAHYDENRLVHELVQQGEPAGELHGHLVHINIETWAELHRKQRGYAIAEAQTLARAGTRARWRNVWLQPPREAWRRFVTWHGYRDGALGLVLAAVMGYYELVKYVHLKGLSRWL